MSETTTSGASVSQSLPGCTDVPSVQGDHRSPSEAGHRAQDGKYGMNTTCDRCSRMYAPMQLLHFSYNGVETLLCFPCLKIVLASLMALPLDARVERLSEWRQIWQEHKLERRAVG